MDLFTECRSIQDSNRSYRRGIELLQEAHRQAMVMIVEGAKEIAPDRKPKSEDDLHNATVRNWCMRVGIVIKPGGHITRALKEQYRIAHEAPEISPANSEVSLPPADVPTAPAPSEAPMVDDQTVREWADSEGITFQRVSKNLRAKYAEVHGNHEQVPT
jgi:hypothetical protein